MKKAEKEDLIQEILELRLGDDPLYPKNLSDSEIPGLEEAAAILCRALRTEKRIVVVGDYDCDGATASVTAVRMMKGMWSEAEVIPVVPDRAVHGYGLTPSIVDEVAELEPDVIVTVDAGVASISGAKRVREVLPECRLVITDHHLPGEELPEADALVDPNLEEGHPLKALAGVGVIWYVLRETAELLKEQGFDLEDFDAERYLDLVAIGTIADVVSLACANNRLIVKKGFDLIRSGKACPGLRALLKESGVDEEEITSLDVGFKIGPRINAAGRLADMSIGVRCLLAESEEEAAPLAQQLTSLNEERKEIEDIMRKVAQMDLDLDSTLLVVAHKEFHPGVVGITASRLKDRFYRPTIVFGSDGSGEYKGSCRSLPGVHMRDFLARLDTLHPGLMLKFGGHAMAAGLSVSEDRIDEFIRAAKDLARDMIPPMKEEPEYDLEIAVSEIDNDLANALLQAAPWGQDFPQPEFLFRCEVRSLRIVGGRHAKLQLKMLDGTGKEVSAWWFNSAERAQELNSCVWDVIASIQPGKKAPELIISYAREGKDDAIDQMVPF